MTVKEAKEAFESMLENREGVVLRDGGKDIAAVVSLSDAELIRRAEALAAIKARSRARSATSSGCARFRFESKAA
jgi:hypothetical protein